MSFWRAICSGIIGFIGIIAFGASVQSPKEKLVSFLTQHQMQIPFKSNFSQIKSVKEMGIELESSGELEVMSAGTAKWTLLTPAYLSVDISPTEIKIYKSKNDTPEIFKKDSAGSLDQNSASWMKFLMDDPEKAMTHFEISEISLGRFKLLPKDKKQGFDFLEIAFKGEPSTGKTQGIHKKIHIQEVYIQENKEDSLRITFLAKEKSRKKALSQ